MAEALDPAIPTRRRRPRQRGAAARLRPGAAAGDGGELHRRPAGVAADRHAGHVARLRARLRHLFQRRQARDARRRRDDLLDGPGPVSEPVARAMAEGALAASKGDLALSITGYAEKDPASDLPGGLVALRPGAEGRRDGPPRGALRRGRAGEGADEEPEDGAGDDAGGACVAFSPCGRRWREAPDEGSRSFREVHERDRWAGPLTPRLRRPLPRGGAPRRFRSAGCRPRSGRGRRRRRGWSGRAPERGAARAFRAAPAARRAALKRSSAARR